MDPPPDNNPLVEIIVDIREQSNSITIKVTNVVFEGGEIQEARTTRLGKVRCQGEQRSMANRDVMTSRPSRDAIGQPPKPRWHPDQPARTSARPSQRAPTQAF